MKFEKFLSAITPIGIFGSAVTGMVMLIVGGETGTPTLMIAGGVVIGVGIGVIAILNVIFRRIGPSLETQLGLDRYADAVTDVADDDDEDGEVPNARYDAILSSRLSSCTVSDIFDREDALTELMERSEMNGLLQHYEDDADKLWDEYEGEESSDVIDKLYELIDKYYGMYRQALPFFVKSETESATKVDEKVDPHARDHEVVKRETKQKEEEKEVEAHAHDHEVVDKESQQPAPVIETPVSPEPIMPAPTETTEQAKPAARSGAAVGYKPMKKK